jgi:hypothetical protein
MDHVNPAMKSERQFLTCQRHFFATEYAFNDVLDSVRHSLLIL